MFFWSTCLTFSHPSNPRSGSFFRSGGNAIRTLTQLRAKHANKEHTWGIDGISGQIVDMTKYGVWEPLAVKAQTIKTAIEVGCLLFVSPLAPRLLITSFILAKQSACLILRVDDIVSGVSKKNREGAGGSGGGIQGGEDYEPEEGDER